MEVSKPTQTHLTLLLGLSTITDLIFLKTEKKGDHLVTMSLKRVI